MHLHQIFFFPLLYLHFLSPYCYICSIPPFFPSLLYSTSHTRPPLYPGHIHCSHPLSASPPLISSPDNLPPPSSATSVPWLCFSFHTSVYAPHSLVPLRPSLPWECVQPYMVREHHGPLVVRAQEIPGNYQTLTAGGREVVTDVLRRKSGEERSRIWWKIEFTLPFFPACNYLSRALMYSLASSLFSFPITLNATSCATVM